MSLKKTGWWLVRQGAGCGVTQHDTILEYSLAEAGQYELGSKRSSGVVTRRQTWVDFDHV